MKNSFKDDYSEGCHPRILERLFETNLVQTVEGNYGEDRFSHKAKELIHKHLNNPTSEIHLVTGGTQANLLVISAALKPYEAVIAAHSGHIAVHETGSIEATGHKVIETPSADGKVHLDALEEVMATHIDEHMVKPRMVYISNATELGTVYSKNELADLKAFCEKYDLFLFMDGARLGSALTSSKNDLSLENLASLTDVFYIGGTKNGALLGEAIVINNPALQPYFRYHIKQKGALLAKGRLLGIQFETLFTDNLFFEIGKNMNQKAQILAEGIQEKGHTLWLPLSSNQVFAILNNDLIKNLQDSFEFVSWQKLNQEETVVRLVTSWALSSEIISDFIKKL